MRHRRMSRVLGASMIVALVASCQAPQPAGPAAVVAAAQGGDAIAPAAQPLAGDPRALLRKASGIPAWLARPPIPAFADAPRFNLKDNLYGLEITLTTNAGDQENVALAYSSTGGAYLAVWQDMRNGAANADVYGQLLTSSGVPSGAAFAISANASGMELSPRVAYNSTANEYLVAWSDSRNGNLDVYTQRVTTGGALTGSALQMASGAGNQILSGLAYHATKNEHLLSWTDDTSGSSILKAGRITAANAKTGTDLTVSATAGALAGGGITVAGTGDYAVVWANDTTLGVYGQRLTNVGALSGSTLTIASGTDEYYTPRIVYNPVTPGYMVAYERRSASTGEGDVYVQRLTSAWALNGAAAATTAATGYQLFPEVSVNTSDGNYFVCWSDGRAGGEQLDIYAKMIKADGTTHIAEYTASATSALQAIPAIAFDSTKKQFLAGWQDSRNSASTGYDMYVQRLVSVPQTADEIMAETLEILNSYEPGTAGGVNGARSQLENAIAKIMADKPANAVTHLENFIAQVQGIDDSIITPEEKAVLIALANEAIDQINAGNW